MWKSVATCLVLLAAAPASAQDVGQESSERAALGSRIGDREADVVGAGTSGDRRASRRLETRVNSRLSTRLDRFSGQADASAYRATPTDRSRETVEPAVDITRAGDTTATTPQDER